MQSELPDKAFKEPLTIELDRLVSGIIMCILIKL